MTSNVTWHDGGRIILGGKLKISKLIFSIVLANSFTSWVLLELVLPFMELLFMVLLRNLVDYNSFKTSRSLVRRLDLLG